MPSAKQQPPNIKHDVGIRPNVCKLTFGPPCIYIIIQGGPKVSTHTLGLIPPSCFILEGCCFADNILYLLVRGFRRKNLKI